MNLFTSHNGNNDTRFSNADYDSLIERASSEQNPKLRAALYAAADAYLCKVKVPIVPTFLSTQNIMVKPWVHGIELNALDLQFFKSVSIGG
jgi:oligopeptide transport system substrate-binding protein